LKELLVVLKVFNAVSSYSIFSPEGQVFKYTIYSHIVPKCEYHIN